MGGAPRHRETKTEPVGESTGEAGGLPHDHACLPPPPSSSSSSVFRLEVTLALDSPHFKRHAESFAGDDTGLWGRANPRVRMHPSEIRLRGECNASNTWLQPIRLASVTMYEKRRTSYPMNILILQRASGSKSHRIREDAQKAVGTG